MSDCEYCDFGLVEYCDARDPRHGFVCTRPAGHNGPHVACAPSNRARIDDHEITEWTDADAEKYSEDGFTAAGGDAA